MDAWFQIESGALSGFTSLLPRRIPALVRPALLVWARERAGMRLEEAAAKAAVEVGQLAQWERGEDKPSIPQLRKLGEVYKRPLAVFFLATPPLDFDPQREFRRLPGVTPQSESSALRLALRTALFRREAARELYARLNEPIPECTASARPDEIEETVGQRIRELVGIPWAAQLDWNGPCFAAVPRCFQWRSRQPAAPEARMKVAGGKLREAKRTHRQARR